MIDPSLTTQEKIDLVEMAKKQIKEEMNAKRPTIEDVLATRENKPTPVANVSGEGFTMKDEAATKSDYNVKFKLAPNIRDLAKLQTDEISADLEYLANKHPEMFNGRPADAFRLIREIKENPTHFYANNRLDYGLIVKRLDGNKIGKLAVEKETGDVKHATKVNDKDLKRLEKISKEKLGNAGIIQTFTRPGSKLENQGLGYQITGIIPQNSQKVKELPPAELRRAIINAKDDKERLAIIENQKAGIRQRLQREDTMKGKEMLDQKLVERANENSQFNRGSAAQRRLNQTLNEVDKLEISEAKKDAVRKKIISEAQKELRASADLIPSNVSGAAGYNAKKVDRQINAVIKARENKEQILKRAGEKNSRFGSFKADIADSEFIKIGNHITLSGKPRIAISFRTLPDASTKFALKKKGFFYDDSIGAWSIEPSKFDEKWISGRLSQLFNKDGATLDLKRAVAEDPFSALPKATATRLRAMKRYAAEKDTPDHLVGDEGWYSRYVTKYEKDRKTLERQLNIEPIKQFGTNYAEFYHDGQGAMKKLLTERKGQVAGAFYRKDLGDIDLIWGEAKQNAKGGWDGYGLAKIEKKHPEITAQILDDVIKNGELEKTHNGYNVKSGRYVIGLNRGWNENGVKIWDNKWIVTAFDDSKEKAISKAPVDSFDGRNAASANSAGIIPQNLKNAPIGEWQKEISKAKDDWSGLKRLMDQIEQNETLKQNERAKLYVDISDRMKKLREAER